MANKRRAEILGLWRLLERATIRHLRQEAPELLEKWDFVLSPDDRDKADIVMWMSYLVAHNPDQWNEPGIYQGVAIVWKDYEEAQQRDAVADMIERQASVLGTQILYVLNKLNGTTYGG